MLLFYTVLYRVGTFGTMPNMKSLKNVVFALLRFRFGKINVGRITRAFIKVVEMHDSILARNNRLVAMKHFLPSAVRRLITIGTVANY